MGIIQGELAARLVYCQDKTAYCRAGGIAGGHANYGLPCVTGFIYWEDGSETQATNCIFCGRQA